MTTDNPVADFLPPLRSPRKVKPKPITASTRNDYKARYIQARKIMFQREYPGVWSAGGYFDKPININTTNGFQNYIQDVLNNLGHMCERINTMGIPHKEKNGQLKWRFSGSTKGSSDLHVTLIGGRSWKIEIKKANDTLNSAQEKYAARSVAVGALHDVIYVGDTDMFWDCYDKYIQL